MPAEAIPSKAVDAIDIADLDATMFRQRFQGRSRPMVITGALGQIPEWTVEYLGRHYSGNRYAVRCYGAGKLDRPKREWRDYSQLREMSFDDYAAALSSGEARRETMYLAQINIAGTVPGEDLRPVLDDVAMRTGLERIPANDINLWLGPGGHREPLHIDPGDSTLMMLNGEKRVALFPPAQSANLYPSPISKGPIPFWVAQVDIERPEFDVHPRLKAAMPHRIDVTVKRGEILYIPAFWWHEVTALGDGPVCSVNRFWEVAPPGRILSTARAAMLWSMAKVPWPVVITVDRTIRRVRERRPAQ